MAARTIWMAACVCGLVLPVEATQPLAERLPGQTLLYVGWSGTKSLHFDGSMFGELLHEPAVGKVLGALRQAARKGLPGKQGEIFEHAWSLAGIAWQRPAALGCLDLSAGVPVPMPTVALLIDLGEQAKAFMEHLEAVLRLAGDDLKVAEATVGAVRYRSIRLPDVPEIAFGTVRKVFFVTFGPDVVKRLIGLPPEQSLKANKSFTACMAKVSGDNEQCALYADVGAIRGRLEGLLAAMPDAASRPTPAKMFEALGLARVSAVAGATRIVDKGMYTKVKLFSPAPHRGLLMPFAGSALTEGDLAAVPADTEWLTAAKISPSALYQEALRIIRTGGPEAEQSFQAALARVEKQLGVSLSNDILANLGDTWVLASAASQGGFLTGTTLTVQVKDAPALAAAVGKVEAFFKAMLLQKAGLGRGGSSARRASPTIETVKMGRVEIHYVALPVGRIPVAPAWAIHKDRLYLAAWPQVIQAAVDNAGKTPLTQDAEFRKWRARVGAKASLFSYVNTPRILRRVYHWLLLGWTTLANLSGAVADKPDWMPTVRPHWMPALTRLEHYLWPEVSAVTADAEGITFERYGSVPFSSVLSCPSLPVQGPALAVSVLLPSLAKARHHAKRAVSLSNLRQIALGALMYVPDHDGQWALDLAVLLGEDLLPGAQGLVSPVSGRRPPKLVNGKLVGEIDYVYIQPPAGRISPAGRIIAYERPENYGHKGTNVAFIDGSVRWMTMAEFRRALERSKAQVKTAPADSQDF